MFISIMHEGTIRQISIVILSNINEDDEHKNSTIAKIFTKLIWTNMEFRFSIKMDPSTL